MIRRVVTVPAHQIRVGDRILPPVESPREPREVVEANWDPSDHDFYIRWEPMTDEGYHPNGSAYMEASAQISLIIKES